MSIAEMPNGLPNLTISTHPVSPRIKQVTVSTDLFDRFSKAVSSYDIQALEYKSFLRFRVAKVLQDLCGDLRAPLTELLKHRECGALLIDVEDFDAAQSDDFVKLTTAFAHLIGRSNHDAMSGQYYARFSVRAEDNSDSYLRKGHRRLELHNDGTFVAQRTDFVLMAKMEEREVTGGNSLLLHVDDWEDCENFANDPLAFTDMRWSAPPSKNTTETVFHSVFGRDEHGALTMSYIDQFVQPDNYEQGVWLADLSDSLESSEQTLSFPMPPGSFLLINNHFWLHGRDKFETGPGLHRELLRQRGYFA